MFKDTYLCSPAANYYAKYGVYTKLVEGTKEYFDFWDEEKRRCLEGYTSSNGIRITGYHYFYLNYFRIDRSVEVTIRGRKVKQREFLQPKFYDGDYEFFWLVDIARYGISKKEYEELNLNVDIHEDDLEGGKSLIVLKARRKGYSYKLASMMTRNYYFLPRSKNFALAFDKKYLQGDGIYQKFLDGMAFIDANTPYIQPRVVDKAASMEIKSGYKVVEDGTEIIKGVQSYVAGVSLKDNPDGVRGKAGELVLFEEMGKFPGLKTAWDITTHTVHEGDESLGFMIAFGCLTENNRVWNNKGELVGIKEINKDSGIIGYDKFTGASKEPVTHLNPPAKKPCVKITTNSGKVIECSTDHPLYWSKSSFGTQPRNGNRLSNEEKQLIDTFENDFFNKSMRPFLKRAKFKIAEEVEIGDQLAVIDRVDIWSDKRMWEPRLTGLLVGDGSYGFDKTPVLSNCDKEINDYIYDNFDAIFESGYKTKDGRDYKETRIKGICKHLRELEIYGQTGKNKRLPKNIHGYCKEDVIEFLSGLFDADGSYLVNSNCVTLASVSNEMLKEVQLLLQKMGVHAPIQEIQLHKTSIKSTQSYFRLEIKDNKSVFEFLSFIKPLPIYKQKSKNQILENLKQHDSSVSKSPFTQGLRFERIIKKEYIGEQYVYNLTAGKTHTYVAEGIVTHNTGGTEGADFESAEELFYNPKVNNCLRINNKWDDGADGTWCGYFVPVYINLAGFMDEHGNSLVDKAIEYEKVNREEKKKSKRSESYSQHIAELPFTPREAVLTFDTNLLPTQELVEQLNYVEVNKKWSTGVTGTLVNTEDGIKFKYDISLKPVYKFPHGKQDDVTGCVVIYESPVRVNGEIPRGLYLACHDPYAHDETTNSASLGVTYIIKRTNEFSQTMNECIVASYVGRPKTQDDYNRQLFNLVEYYNAELGFENDRGDTVAYARRFKKLKYLAKQFEFTDKKELQGKTKRSYGMNMTKQRKQQGEIYLRDWLLTPTETLEDGRKKLILHHIYDPALLEELIKFNHKGNFDRAMALIVGMYHRQEVYNLKVRSIKENNHKEFFERFYKHG